MAGRCSVCPCCIAQLACTPALAAAVKSFSEPKGRKPIPQHTRDEKAPACAKASAGRQGSEAQSSSRLPQEAAPQRTFAPSRKTQWSLGPPPPRDKPGTLPEPQREPTASMLCRERTSV